MFEPIMIEAIGAKRGEPGITINPVTGRITLNAVATSAFRAAQYRYAVFYFDVTANQLAIEQTHKEGVKFAVTAKIGKGKVTQTVTWRAPEVVARARVTKTMRYPITRSAVKLKLSDAVGDNDERELIVVNLADGTVPPQKGRKV